MICQVERLVFGASARPSALLLAALLAALVLGAGGHAQAQQGGASAASAARVIELRIGDEVEPVMAEYIDNGIEPAAREHASLVLITMDTPGGLETSMQDMISHILSSPVPVAVFVSPTGSRGASARLLHSPFGGHRGDDGARYARGRGFTLAGGRRLSDHRGPDARKENHERRDGFLAQLFRKARPQRDPGGNRGDRRQSLHRRRSPAGQAHRPDREIAGRSAGATRWAHDHAL